MNRLQMGGRGFWRGIIDGVFVAVMCLGLTACFDKITGPSQTTIIDQSNPQPQASPSPTAACDVRTVALGTAADDFQLSAGGSDSVTLVVTVLGSQGLELPSLCRAQLTPAYSTTGPCQISGGGFEGVKVTSATAGACDVTARVGNSKNEVPLHLTVVP